MRVYILALLIVLSGCTNQELTLCSSNYEPVCGSDGVTYRNSCFANLSNVSFSLGECLGCVDTDNLDFSKKGSLLTGEMDYCIDNKTLIEYFCENGTKEMVQICNGLCFEGSCIETACADTDGNNIFSMGQVDYNGVKKIDFCISELNVIEYSCFSEEMTNTSIQCPADYVCKDGYCVNDSCIDSDGFDIFRSGIVSANGSKFEDRCTDSRNGIEYRCFEGNAKDFVTFGCPNGFNCKKGACEPTCFDLDNGINISIASSVAYGSEIYEDLCVNSLQVSEYSCDNQGFVSTVENCPRDTICNKGRCVLKNCFDHDGENIFEKGTTTKGTIEEYDYCLNASVVKEQVCVKDNILSIELQCDFGYGCFEGRCIDDSMCHETDSGIDIYKKGITSKIGKENGSDFCVNDNVINEYYCSSNDIVLTTLECGQGYICKNSSCVSNCIDSDLGNDPQNFGILIFGNTSISDSCFENAVQEYFCENEEIKSQIHTCTNGDSCIEGKCVSNCLDSDNYNIFEKGKVNYGSKSFEDYCLVPHISKEGVEYVCEGSMLLESNFTCTTGFSCYDGKCNPICEDSDGNDKFKKGYIAIGNETIYDKCTDIKTGIEYTCKTGLKSENNFECLVNQECFDGRCIAKTT